MRQLIGLASNVHVENCLDAVRIETEQVGLRLRLEYQPQVNAIASKYQIPIVEDDSVGKYRFLLDFDDGVLQLIEPGRTRFRPIYVKLDDTKRLSRRTLLGRAIGRKVDTVIDATAGFGGDLLLLAKMGYSVLAVERHPVVAALLEDGIVRALDHSESLAIKHCFMDARLNLAKLHYRPEVIYIDPMYPPGRKPSVKVARPIEVLRDLVGNDIDAGELFSAALTQASKRVVVKRPRYADPLSDLQLSRSLLGKLVRYDIYDVSE